VGHTYASGTRTDQYNVNDEQFAFLFSLLAQSARWVVIFFVEIAAIRFNCHINNIVWLTPKHCLLLCCR
jgi:hypothetical protein